MICPVLKEVLYLNARKFLLRTARHTKDFISLHAEDILSVAAGIGVVATGILSYNAGRNISNSQRGANGRADSRSVQANEERPRIYRAAAAPIITAGATICCIAGTRAISRKRQASLIAAGAAFAESLNTYRESVCEPVKIQQSNTSNIEDTGTGDIIFIEEFTGRRFKASREHVENAIKDFTLRYAFYGYSKLNDLYSYLKIPSTLAGDMLGWQYMDNWFFDNHDEIDFETANTELGIILEDYPSLGTVLRYTNLPDYVSF